MDKINVLLPVVKMTIGERENNAVDGRTLHNFLESKRQFSNWIKSRIIKYEFVENKDFTSFNKIVKRENGASTRLEYTLTLDMAKQLAMVENNKQGTLARKYFISCEQKLKQAQQEIIELANDPFIALRIQAIKTAKKVQKNAKEIELNKDEIHLLKQEVNKVGAKITTKNEQYYTISGYAVVIGIKVVHKTAISLGKEATKLSKERGIPIGSEYDAKYGRINSYHTHILQIIFTNFKNS